MRKSSVAGDATTAISSFNDDMNMKKGVIADTFLLYELVDA